MTPPRASAHGNACDHCKLTGWSHSHGGSSLMKTLMHRWDQLLPRSPGARGAPGSRQSSGYLVLRTQVTQRWAQARGGRWAGCARVAVEGIQGSRSKVRWC